MFGHEVAAGRHRLQLTQEELAARTGLSVRSIRNIESGHIVRPRLATIRLLREVLSPAAVPAGPSPDQLRPMQLPLDIPHFTGRVEHLAALDEMLGADQQSTVVISAVAGAAGVGKTALAIHWAHRVASQFIDGVLYTNLRGFDPDEAIVSPTDAVRGFLTALAVPADRIPPDLAARVGLYRSLLAGRRMLIVADNARNADQVRPLLPGVAGCVVVVTSRNQLGGLVAGEGARPVLLDQLHPDEARDLLRARIGTDRLAAEPDAVNDIVARCSGLPLALSLVAAHAVTHPGFPLAAVAKELQEGRWELAAGDIRTVFSWSYRALPPRAGRLFRLLGLHAGPDASARAAASLAGEPLPAVRPVLTELAEAHLITEQHPGRYGFHDLLRVYAAGLAAADDSEATRRAATHRLLDHYLHTAHAAAVRIQPQWAAITPVPPSAAVVVEPIADQPTALAWFVPERPVLLAAIQQAAATGFDAHAWQLAWALTAYLAPNGLLQDQLTCQHIAVDAAARLGDRAGQALASRLLARAYSRTGQYDEAETHLRGGLDLYAALGDHTGEAQTHHNYAELCDLTDRPAEALRHAQRALALYRVAGNRTGEARALNGVGLCHALLHDYEQAIVYSAEALAMQRESGDHNGQAASLDSIGGCYQELDRHADAVVAFGQAAELFRRSADRVHEAATLTRLSQAQDATGDHAGAREARQRAERIYADLGSRKADPVKERPRP